MLDMLLIVNSFSIKKLINEIMEKNEKKNCSWFPLYQHLYNNHKLTNHACVSFKWIHMHL